MKFLALLLLVIVASSAAGKSRLGSRGSVRWGLKLGHPVAETSPFQVTTDEQQDLAQDDLFRVAPGRGGKKPVAQKPHPSPGSEEHEGSGGGDSHSSESIEETEAPKMQSDRANRNAFYHFQSVVKDGIKDGQVERHETRQGLKVTGSYSYTDGYVHRTVEYEADDKGYRIIKEKVTKIGDGPKENQQGVASVETEAFGRKNAYSISGKDLRGGWRGKGQAKFVQSAVRKLK